jgi:drug/metabolite transporter (DMT)-like permease
MKANIHAILTMTLSMLCFTVGDTFVKVVGSDLPISQIMFLRGLFATLFIAGACIWTGAFRQWRTLLIPLMAWRTVGEIAATAFYFAGLMRMSFSDAVAIGQVTPLAVTAAAAIFLSEPIGWRSWTATAVGFLGVLLIIRPGTSAFNPAAILILGAVAGVVLRDLITRIIGTTIPITLITTAAAASITLAGLALAPFETWATPAPWHFGYLATAAACVLGGYVLTILSTRSGDISVVSPFRYTSAIFGVAIGVLIFRERIDTLTLIGLAIVIAAGIYTFAREAKRRAEVTNRATS